MNIVRGKTIEPMTQTAFDALAAGHDSVTLDLGAGDGRWAYHHALAHPRELVIAMDPVREAMREASARASKKREKGGALNALFVVASIEMPPQELRGAADDVRITLPWGSLMRGLILGEEFVLRGIASLAKPGAIVRVILNTRIFDDPVPLDARDLPEATPEYAQRVLAPAYAACGMSLQLAREFDADEMAALPTTWAKRLSHRQPPRSLYLEAEVLPSARLA